MMTTSEEDQYLTAMENEAIELAGIAEEQADRQYREWLADRLEDGYSAEESTTEDWADELEASLQEPD